MTQPDTVSRRQVLATAAGAAGTAIAGCLGSSEAASGELGDPAERVEVAFPMPVNSP